VVKNNDDGGNESKDFKVPQETTSSWCGATWLSPCEWLNVLSPRSHRRGSLCRLTVDSKAAGKLAPAELVQMLVVDAEIVGYFVDQRDVNLLAQLLCALAGINVLGPVQNDAVREFTNAVVKTVC
jgi:hypothetical protein